MCKGLRLKSARCLVVNHLLFQVENRIYNYFQKWIHRDYSLGKWILWWLQPWILWWLQPEKWIHGQFQQWIHVNYSLQKWIHDDSILTKWIRDDYSPVQKRWDSKWSPEFKTESRMVKVESFEVSRLKRDLQWSSRIPISIPMNNLDLMFSGTGCTVWHGVIVWIYMCMDMYTYMHVYTYIYIHM